MAINTPKDLRNALIYCVYVRNYGKNGKFTDVTSDLARIKELGTDIVWFLPIHPIGIKHKKGDLGCPYAIKNYREVNAEYGSLADFEALIAEIHRLDMKCMIDVVYNHTSPDSWLSENHPEFFYKKPDGHFGNKTGDWWDVIDLEYANKDLWDYQVESLKYWASLGVDGFRCDVASLVPVDFWVRARKEVAEINPDHIWLAESVHIDFVSHHRSLGNPAFSDSELYAAFDILYDYDIHVPWVEYFEGKAPLKEFMRLRMMQEGMYPANYLKMRCLENHDQERAKKIIPDPNRLAIWTAFIYFDKGVTQLYNGQEAQDPNRPSLFDVDKVNWSGMDSHFVHYLKELREIKRLPIIRDGIDTIAFDQKYNSILSTYTLHGKKLVGVFNVESTKGSLEIDLPDGKYTNLIDGEDFEIKAGKLALTCKPVIFWCK